MAGEILYDTWLVYIIWFQLKKKKNENNAETKQVQHIGRKKKTQLLFKGIYSGRLAFVLCKYIQFTVILWFNAKSKTK